jgi:hypothetical protein
VASSHLLHNVVVLVIVRIVIIAVTVIVFCAASPANTSSPAVEDGSSMPNEQGAKTTLGATKQ